MKVDFNLLKSDTLNVTGAVNLTNANLSLSLLNAPGVLASPQTYLLVTNDGTDAVVGTFSPVNLGANSQAEYSINYAFTGTALNGTGDGNDIAITFRALPEPAVSFVFLAWLPLRRRRQRLAQSKRA